MTPVSARYRGAASSANDNGRKPATRGRTIVNVSEGECTHKPTRADR
jgi:hypothetical protein